MNTPTVHLVDDDESCLRASTRVLSAAGFIVRAFTSGQEFLATAGPDSRGCVVADLEMPGLDGLALQATMGRAGLLMPIVFLSGRGDIPRTVRAIQEGAVDFVEKTAPQHKLLEAVRRALARDVSESDRRLKAANMRERLASLTPREHEVLGEVVAGLLNKQIAAKLGISERTVKMHRTAITRKLGVHSTARLAVLAREAGLFETG
jgi:FixJ family two-component response regulator